MNPTKTLLTLFVFLLPLSVTAGELDGKSLICIGDEELELYRDDVVGFNFVDGNVSATRVEERELKYRISTFGESLSDKSYTATRNEVTWFESAWVLNRKTLEMTSGKKMPFKGRYQCEVLESFDVFYDKLVRIQAEKQRLLEEELKQNKI